MSCGRQRRQATDILPYTQSKSNSGVKHESGGRRQLFFSICGCEDLAVTPPSVPASVASQDSGQRRRNAWARCQSDRPRDSSRPRGGRIARSTRSPSRRPAAGSRWGTTGRFRRRRPAGVRAAFDPGTREARARPRATGRPCPSRAARCDPTTTAPATKSTSRQTRGAWLEVGVHPARAGAHGRNVAIPVTQTQLAPSSRCNRYPAVQRSQAPVRQPPLPKAGHRIDKSGAVPAPGSSFTNRGRPARQSFSPGSGSGTGATVGTTGALATWIGLDRERLLTGRETFRQLHSDAIFASHAVLPEIETCDG